jgi:4-amino-4-deoxy-L-arabinose transferase-like glycosyltransferase
VNDAPATRTAWIGWTAAISVAVATYLFGLGSQQILRNGDEMVYAHITRLTAASGHWLPLASELPGMRNTKPPFLFWQGIVSTDWGTNWTLFALRWPSVVWSFLTAALAGALAWKLSGRSVRTGLFAALAYLAFFAVYRYGRPFLVNPPETFFTTLALWIVLWRSPASFRSTLLVPVLVGLATGIVLFTKSFAQLVPIGATLAWWHLRFHGYRPAAFLRSSLGPLGLVALVSLAVFSLWFVLSPDRADVWREFVVGENFGKLEAKSEGSYLTQMFWGGSSVWPMLAGYLVNAGLLAFPVFGVAVECWKHRRELSDEERLLWIWMITLLVVFCLPSQRSSRYLLDAMPALAVILALRGHHVGRDAFVLTLVASLGVLAPLGWLGFTLDREVGGGFGPWHWPLLLASAAFIAFAMVRKPLTKAAAPVAALLVMLNLAGFLSIFDGPLGRFDEATRSAAAGRTVWVPHNFNGGFEQHRFVLPGAEVRGYRTETGLPPASDRGPDDLAIEWTSLDAAPPAGSIGSRIDMSSRHSGRQLREMATGKVREHLFRREWLVAAPGVPR